MASTGVIFKRCGCRDSTGRRLDRGCARLVERQHGSWCFHCSVTDLWGRRARIRRGGYPLKAAACRARDEVLRQSCSLTTAQSWTVAHWSRYWLGTRRSIRPSTLLFYTLHVERYLIPHLGRIRLADLTTRDIAAMFATLEQTPSRRGSPLAPGSLQRIRATLRAALNGAIREGLLTINPARLVELANPHRSHAVVWTDRRVTAWRQTGTRPAVAVWTARQAAEFLDQVAEDRLFAVWWLIVLRGLRRGEAARLRWEDVDFDRRQITIAQQLTMCGRTLLVSPPKSAASQRTVALDRRTADVLRAHARRRHAMRVAAGPRWTETGYVFTRPNGLPLQPNYLTQRFHLLVQRHDLPPVRLHDLRHGAASLAHSAGADLKSSRTNSDTPASCSPPTPPDSSSPPPADCAPNCDTTPSRLVILRPAGPNEPRTGERSAGPGQGDHKKRSRRIKKAQQRARRATAQAQHHRGTH